MLDTELQRDRSAQLLRFLIPYDQSRFSVSVPLEIAQQRLAAALASDLVLGENSWFAMSTRYKGSCQGNRFRLRGPYGNRKTCVLTKGEMNLEQGKTIVRLSQRIDTVQLIGTAIVLILYVVAATVILSGSNTAMFIVFPAQTLFIYMIMLAVFRFEANQIRRLLVKTMEQETPPSKPSDLPYNPGDFF